MARAPRVAEHPELGLPERRKLWQTEGLFSDHYLKTKSARNTRWPNDSEAEPIWHFCKELYEKRYVACARNNEQFTRQELLDKIFERLGFAWTDNLSLPETQQHLEPDYILFASAVEKEAVIDRSPTERYRSAIVIVEAKKVNHPLSQISRTQLRYPAPADPRLSQRSADARLGHPDERERMATLRARREAEPLFWARFLRGDRVAREFQILHRALQPDVVRARRAG